MSFRDKKLTVDELIAKLQFFSDHGKGNYFVKVEEYTVDDGDSDYSDDESCFSDEHKQVYFSGTP